MKCLVNIHNQNIFTFLNNKYYDTNNNIVNRLEIFTKFRRVKLFWI